MMKLFRNYIWLLTLSVLFVNCSDNDSNTGEVKAGPADDGGKYTDVVVTVNRDGVKTDKSVLRFYSNRDGVPYISMSDFHKVMMPNAGMKVSRQGDSYEITTSGGTAVVDVKADRLTTSSMLSIFDMISSFGSPWGG